MSEQSDPAAKTAVVGAGIAGMTAARALADGGHPVVVYEKARGPGGAARRRQAGYRFDHGAQYFTAREPAFRTAVEAGRAAGVIAEWAPRIEVFDADGRRKAGASRRYVAVPGMSALARHLGEGVPVHAGREVTAARLGDAGWTLTFADDSDVGPYETLLVTAPAPQSGALMESACPDLSARIGGVPMLPCWAVMAAWDAPLAVDLDAAFVDQDTPLRWIARDSSKPGRPDAETWVLHGRPDWSRAHLERPHEEVAERLVEAFGRLLGIEPPPPAFTAAHRWRHALVERPIGVPCLVDDAARAVAAGDWCTGSRLEAAFMSGRAAAAAILGRGGR